MDACKCDYIEWNSIFDFNKINVITVSLYYIALLISQILCAFFTFYYLIWVYLLLFDK